MHLLVVYLSILDVAQLALHRCVECTYCTDGKSSNRIAEICYSYEFLDDFITPKPTVNSFLVEFFGRHAVDKHIEESETIIANQIALEEMAPKYKPTVQSVRYTNDETAKDKPVLECEDNSSWLQEKFDPKNHPLELMVSFK